MRFRLTLSLVNLTQKKKNQGINIYCTGRSFILLYTDLIKTR